MHRCLVVAVIFLGGCRDGRLVGANNTKCGTPCYGGNAKYAGVGICDLGVWKCTESGELDSCVGWVAPGEPSCNGLDNDCSGRPDALAQYCTGGCGVVGIQVCSDGVWGVCSAAPASKETCNGVDDDCDGIIDNVVYDDPFCYTGPQSTIGKGECRPGFKACEYGTEVCAGEVLPKSEVCNSLDDDCNGTVDDGQAAPPPKDVVFCIDNSGSMQAVINKIRVVTQKFAVKYKNRPDLKWALEECPGYVGGLDGTVRVAQNFTDADTFNAAVSLEHVGLTGLEPTIDAVYYTADPVNPLHLNWRAGASRVMIMFTDEDAQSYDTPQNTAAQAGMKAAASNMPVFIFTKTDSMPTYVEITDASDGGLLDIDMSEYMIGIELDKMVNVCK